MNQPKSKQPTGRGGVRQGAGRKPGSATKRTRAIADKAAAEGKTPLEVMLETMCDFMDQAKEVARSDPDARFKLMVAASSVAKDAAPYIHPRLQAIEHTGAGGGKLQFETILLELAEKPAEHHAKRPTADSWLATERFRGSDDCFVVVLTGGTDPHRSSATIDMAPQSRR